MPVHNPAWTAKQSHASPPMRYPASACRATHALAASPRDDERYPAQPPRTSLSQTALPRSDQPSLASIGQAVPSAGTGPLDGSQRHPGARILLPSVPVPEVLGLVSFARLIGVLARLPLDQPPEVLVLVVAALERPPVEVHLAAQLAGQRLAGLDLIQRDVSPPGRRGRLGQRMEHPERDRVAPPVELPFPHHPDQRAGLVEPVPV